MRISRLDADNRFMILLLGRYWEVTLVLEALDCFVQRLLHCCELQTQVLQLLV